MSSIPDFSTVVAVDCRTIDQLKLVWPTWRKFKPEILRHPLVPLIDERVMVENRSLDWLDHPDIQPVIWDWDAPGATQRERMLTAFVFAAPIYVDTPYWLKIDTDVVATNHDQWIFPEWFEENPAIIASPWGYTKPAHWLSTLEAWGDTVDQLSIYPKVGLTPDPDKATYRYQRIASWLSWIRTDWSREVAGYNGNRLPVPSQDTYHWYVAARRGDKIVRARMKRYGWSCLNSGRNRKKLVEEVMNEVD